MSFSCCGTRVHLGFGFLAAVGLCAFLDPTRSVPAILISVLIHEMGHLAAMLALGIGVREITFHLFGARITPRHRQVPGYAREALIHLSGPLLGLFAALLFSRMPIGCGALLCRAGLMLSAFNLLPVRTLDGGGILFAGLCHALGPTAADRLLRVISALVLLPLCGGAFWMLYRGGENLSLLILSTYLMLTAVMR